MPPLLLLPTKLSLNHCSDDSFLKNIKPLPNHSQTTPKPLPKKIECTSDVDTELAGLDFQKFGPFLNHGKHLIYKFCTFCSNKREEKNERKRTTKEREKNKRENVDGIIGCSVCC